MSRPIKICWLDAETTGLNPSANGIIQLAGIIEIKNPNNPLPVMESFNFNMNIFPNDEVQSQALEKNNTTLDKIKGFQDPEVVYTKLIKLLNTYVDKFNKKDKFFFGGYNATFDIQFLREWFNKNRDKYFGSYFWSVPIDVMILAGDKLMNKRPDMANFQLGTVAKEFGVNPTGDLHDAMVDIELTRELYWTIKSSQEQGELF